MKGEKPPAPARGVSPSSKDVDDADGSEENDNETDGAALEDLIPRTDIR